MEFDEPKLQKMMAAMLEVGAAPLFNANRPEERMNVKCCWLFGLLIPKRCNLFFKCGPRSREILVLELRQTLF